MIEVFTGENCPNCLALKKRLNDEGIEFIELHTEEEEIMLKMYMIGRCTVPTVALDGMVVDYESLEELIVQLKRK